MNEEVMVHEINYFTAWDAFSFTGGLVSAFYGMFSLVSNQVLKKFFTKKCQDRIIITINDNAKKIV
jgi:hypothetical protein